MKKIYPIVMGILALLLLVVCALQAVQLSRTKERLARARAVQVQYERAINSQTDAVEEAVEAPLPLASQESESTPTAMEELVEVVTSADPAEDQDIKGKRFARMMKDPKQRALMESGWVLETDHAYASLFRGLELPPEKLEQLKLLLLEKRAIETDFLVQKLEAGQDGDTLRVQIQEDQEIALADQQIRDLIGLDGYVDLQEYEKSIHERTMLLELNRSLQNVQIGLTHEQEDDLIDIMYGERAGLPILHAIFEGDVFPGSMTEDQIAQATKESRQWHDRVLNRTSIVLTEKQRRLFQDHMAFQRDAFEVGLQEADLFIGIFSSDEE